MAEQLHEGEEWELPGDRRKMICRAMREVSRLQAERARIGEEIASVKQRLIKGALGWKLKDWGILKRIYDLEQEDRDQTMAVLREGFAALEIGEQLDWISAIGADDGAVSATAGNGNAAGYAVQMGREAGLAGKNPEVNPHLEGSEQFALWHQGWMEGQAELAHGLTAEPPKRGRGRPRKSSAAEAAFH